jgi:riboflavin kinase/FMN adenylyltransferase
MRVARSLAELTNITPSVVTIGNFDGVHCGHRMVIASVLDRAKALNAQSVAVTFDPHPAHVLRTDSRLPLITPLAEKLDLLAATGLDLTLVLPFTDDLRLWSARRFAETVLRDALHAAEVHEGETFRFGHNAAADIASLSDLGQDLGFAVRAYDPRIVRGSPISSSRIRTLIAAGNLSQARTLLGRSFSIRSTPASGRGYGTKYAVPTINLAPYPELLPAHGVYITTLKIGAGPTAQTFRGVTNIGNRPTFGADSFAVETHLFDFHPIDLTDTTPLDLTFFHRLRPERRFNSPDLLRTQIGLDVLKALRYFALTDALTPKSSR